MADVEIYHPETQATVAVAEESVWHYRQSGWVKSSEWAETLADQAKAAKAAAPAEDKVPAARAGVASKEK